MVCLTAIAVQIPVTGWTSGLIGIGGGIVHDTDKGVFWQQNDDLTNRTWNHAQDFCANSTLGGINNWRLPEKEALQSIVGSLLFGVYSTSYWTQTTCDTSPVGFGEWAVNLNSGLSGCKEDTRAYRVICVTDAVSNRAPTVNNDTLATNTGEAKTGIFTGSDPDGDSLTFSIVDYPTNGSISLGPSNNFTYTPNTGHSGTDSFTFKGSDGSLTSNIGTISVTINNQSPTAIITISPSSGDTETSFQFDASDSSDPEDATSALQVRWDWETDGVWDTNYSTTHTATHKYISADSYTVTMEVKDSNGLTDTTNSTIAVTDDNIAINNTTITPKAIVIPLKDSNGKAPSDPSSSLVISATDRYGETILFKDGSPDSPGAITYSVMGDGEYSLIRVNMSSFTHQWAAGDQVHIEVTTGLSLSNDEKAIFDVTLSNGMDDVEQEETLTPSNDKPIIVLPLGVPDQVVSLDQSQNKMEFSFDVSDPESDVTELTVVARSCNADLIPNSQVVLDDSVTGSKQVTVTPHFGKTGRACVEIEVSDGEGLSTKDQFEFDILLKIALTLKSGNNYIPINLKVDGLYTAEDLESLILESNPNVIINKIMRWNPDTETYTGFLRESVGGIPIPPDNFDLMVNEALLVVSSGNATVELVGEVVENEFLTMSQPGYYLMAANFSASMASDFDKMIHEKTGLYVLKIFHFDADNQGFELGYLHKEYHGLREPVGDFNLQHTNGYFVYLSEFLDQ